MDWVSLHACHNIDIFVTNSDHVEHVCQKFLSSNSLGRAGLVGEVRLSKEFILVIQNICTMKEVVVGRQRCAIAHDNYSKLF